MSPLIASVEQFQSLVDQQLITQELRKYQHSMESLVDVGRTMDPAVDNAAPFGDLVTRVVDIGGMDLPDNVTDSVNTSLEFLDGLIEKVKIVLKGRESVMAKKPKPGSTEALEENNRWGKDYEAACVKLRQDIKDFYLNDKWLDAQTFVEGPIKADDFSGRFTYKGKIRSDIEKAYRESKSDYDTMVGKYAPLVNTYVQALKKIDQDVIKQTKGEEDVKVVDDVLRAAIIKMEALPYPLDQMGGAPTQYLGGVTLKFGKHLLEDKKELLKGVATLPALDKAGVKAMGKLMLEILDLHDTWPDLPYDGVYCDDSDDYRGHFDDSAVMGKYYDICEVNSLDWALSESAYSPFFRMQDLIGSLDKWVDRSIK